MIAWPAGKIWNPIYAAPAEAGTPNGLLMELKLRGSKRVSENLAVFLFSRKK
jgi:hypothetical protein